MLSKNVILIVDDSELNRKLLVRILSEEYEILQAGNGREALEILAQNCGEIAGIVLDLIMPGMDGYAFLEETSKVEGYRNTPILVATADVGSEVENRCLKLGAWDFVRKPYNPNTVRLRLQNIISRSRLYLMEQLRYMAEHDALTGLYNREKFFEVSRQMLNEHPQEQFAFVRLDIDRFRLVNTFFGEEEGNRLLRFMATKIIEIAKHIPCLTYGRMEADVFCFCQPYNEQTVLAMVDETRHILREYTQQYYVEPSFGIYVIEDPTISVETMYARASMAAEKCKGQYSQYYAYYDDSLSESAFKSQRILNEMEGALEQRQFQVYFQPKYDLKTDKPCGAEALVRWMHPERGMISPGEFIPVFEHNGFISHLDYYVWEEACRLLRKWIDEGRNPAPVSVNVSRVNMYNPSLVDSLKELTERYQIPPHLLNLELTESAYMDNPEVMRKTLARLHQCGFLVMMDDFGSGYSSLNTLRDIDVDILKIDMNFLPSGESNGRSECILVSVIRMAGWLGIPVIMEGVETRSQRDFLQSVGCGYVQGYYYARPMPVEEYERLMANGQSRHFPERLEESHRDILGEIWQMSDCTDILFRYVRQPMVVCEVTEGQVLLLRMNRAFIERVQYARDEGDLHRLADFVEETSLPHVRAAFHQAVDQEGSAECVCQCRRNDGDWMWLRMHLQYLQETARGNLIMITLDDVTRERELEARLEAYQREAKH